MFFILSFIFFKSPDAKQEDLLGLILILIPVFGLLVIGCDVNERLTGKFERFDDDLWEQNWYLYPIKLQQMFLIFGLDTQQPVNVRGYGNILCTRETLKKVISIKLKKKRN